MKAAVSTGAFKHRVSGEKRGGVVGAGMECGGVPKRITPLFIPSLLPLRHLSLSLPVKLVSLASHERLLSQKHDDER